MLDRKRLRCVYIRIKHMSELCQPAWGDWLVKASSVCVWWLKSVCVLRGSLYPNYSAPWWQTRGRYQGKTSLGRAQTQECLLSWALQGLRSVCVCVCVMQLCPALQPKVIHLHTTAEVNARAHGGRTQTRPTDPVLGLFILPTEVPHFFSTHY